MMKPQKGESNGVYTLLVHSWSILNEVHNPTNPTTFFFFYKSFFLNVYLFIYDSHTQREREREREREAET